MIITRKIQVYVKDDNQEQKKDYIHTIYEWRDLVRKAANVIVAHKFTQQNIRDFVYLKDDIKEKFYVKDILKEGKCYRDWETDRKSTRLNSSHSAKSRMPSSA